MAGWRLTDREVDLLRALSKRLEGAHQTLLSCVVHDHDTDCFVVTDPRTGREIAQIPAGVLDRSDVGRSILSMLGTYCQICRAELIEGEEAICGTCEGTEVMGLLRLRDHFS